MANSRKLFGSTRLCAFELHEGTAMQLYSEPGAARFLRISLATLQRLRKAGKGPVYFRYYDAGRRLYRQTDLDAWLASRLEGGDNA